jgi:enoyl-[acyl-carrier protein] reductase II
MAGQSVGMVAKEQPTAEIIRDMIEEALSALADRHAGRPRRAER